MVISIVLLSPKLPVKLMVIVLLETDDEDTVAVPDDRLTHTLLNDAPRAAEEQTAVI